MRARRESGTGRQPEPENLLTTTPDPIDVHVGARLREGRHTKGVTLAQLGAAMEVRFQQVQKYETGQNRLSASALWKAACCLSVEPNFFFHGLDHG